MRLDFSKEMVWVSLKIAAVSVIASISLTYVMILLVGVRTPFFWDHMATGLNIAGFVAFCVGFPVGNIFMQQSGSLKIANEKLLKLVRHDHLTGLLSRAIFFEEVDQQQNNNHGKSSAVFFMDLDHFKKINDRYGHSAGDAVLRRFGELIIEQHEDGDLAGRLGGEEFAVYLPNCSREKAELRAKRLAQSFSEQLIRVDEMCIRSTVSIGVFVDGKQADLDTMLRQADALMYKAKKDGRNQVVARTKVRNAA